MTFKERIIRLLSYELKQGTNIATNNFKVVLDRLAIDHCSLEHLAGDERLEIQAYKDKIWSEIQSGKIQIDYLTSNTITLSSLNI